MSGDLDPSQAARLIGVAYGVAALTLAPTLTVTLTLTLTLTLSLSLTLALAQTFTLTATRYGVAAACLVPLAALSSAPAWQLGLSSLIGAASAYVYTQVKSDPLAAPQLGACASSGRAWRLRAAWRSQEEAGPLGSQPLPQNFELAASKAAHLPGSTIQVYRRRRWATLTLPTNH